LTQRSRNKHKAKVLVLAHCLLNSATKWWQDERLFEKNRGPCREVVKFLSKKRIGAIQLPCPEYTFCGNPRPPRTKDEYEDMPSFRLHCENLALEVARNLKTLISKDVDSRVKILAILGVERSPTCGVKCTPRKVDGQKTYVEEKGLFLEILDRELLNLGLKLPFVGVNFCEQDEITKVLYNLCR